VIDVWAVRLDLPDTAAQRALLGPDELERASAFRFAHDARRFVARRAFVRVVLGGYPDLAPAAVRFEVAAHGKPAVASAPGSLDWNLSHPGELAVVVVARGAEVGVDVEEVRPLARLNSVARLVCSPTERDALRALPAPARAAAFLQLWTREEALVKASGAGLRGLTRPPDARYRLADLGGFEGYVGAVAARAYAAA